MNKVLHISPDKALPLDAATQTFAFIARKGAGKTYAAGKLVEELMNARSQVIVLDPVGNWYGLRLSANGKDKGFDIPVFGGLRGDLPLNAQAGELIADIAADTTRSIIIDLSQFSLADRKRFAVTFGERLWKRKKGESHPSPVTLVIEESQLIIPQFVRGGGDEARMVGIYEEIVRLGRNYGIGVVMISQRPQSVNKEVLNQTECLFVGQVNGAQERKALKDWITHQGMDTKLVDELPSLPIGTMYIWSPQWLGILEKIKIGTKTTFDASATPKVGDKTVRRDPAPLDLGEIETRMAAIVEEKKRTDPRALQGEVRKLQGEVALWQKNAADAGKACRQQAVEKSNTLIKPVFKKGEFERVEKMEGRLVALLREFQTLVTELQKTMNSAGVAAMHPNNQGVKLAPVRSAMSPSRGLDLRGVAQPGRAVESRDTKTRPQAAGSNPAPTNLAPRHQEIINAIGFYKAIGVHPCDKKQIAGFCVRPFNGNFRSDLAVLRTANLIDYPQPAVVALTDAGESAITVLPPVNTQSDLHNLWLKRLAPRHADIFSELLRERATDGRQKLEVAHALGREFNGNFRSDLSVLRTLGIIDYPTPGTVGISDQVLPPLPA